MAKTLNAQDFKALQQFVTEGDRYGYWNYLKEEGDPYAKMALGVVTGDTRDGFMANNYAASFAPAGSRLADPDIVTQEGKQRKQGTDHGFRRGKRGEARNSDRQRSS